MNRQFLLITSLVFLTTSFSYACEQKDSNQQTELQTLLNKKLKKLTISIGENGLSDKSSGKSITSLAQFSKLKSHKNTYKYLLYHKKNAYLTLFAKNTDPKNQSYGKVSSWYLPFYIATDLKHKFCPEYNNDLQELHDTSNIHLIKTIDFYQNDQPISYTEFDNDQNSYTGPQESKDTIIGWAQEDIKNFGLFNTKLNKKTLIIPDIRESLPVLRNDKKEHPLFKTTILGDPEADTIYQKKIDQQELRGNPMLFDIQYPAPGITQKYYSFPQYTLNTDSDSEKNEKHQD